MEATSSGSHPEPVILVRRASKAPERWVPSAGPETGCLHIGSGVSAELQQGHRGLGRGTLRRASRGGEGGKGDKYLLRTSAGCADGFTDLAPQRRDQRQRRAMPVCARI
jgi:hypothetical protein